MDALLLTIAIAAAGPASGSVVEQSRAWDAGLGAPSSVVFQPFDPQLGSLVRVDVLLSGVMALQGFAPPQPDGVAGFTAPPTTLIGRRSDIIADSANEFLGIQQQFFVPGLPLVIGAPVAGRAGRGGSAQDLNGQAPVGRVAGFQPQRGRVQSARHAGFDPHGAQPAP
jgi:hypothetical protein